MTRNALAIVALFLGLVGTHLTPVSADSACTSFAREQCERVAAITSSTASFSVVAPANVHWFTPGGVAREHFEAMSVLAPESYRMAPAPAVGGKFGQAEYDQILVSMEDVTGVTAPVVSMNDQQRYREESTTAANTVASTTTECTHPAIGFPTCYTLQADGTWAREELSDIDANWIVVGTVTADEVAAAIGDANATAVHGASFGPAATVPGIDYRFVEQNTITLPNVSAADALTPMMSAQQRALEESTTAAATVPDYRTIDAATDDDRLMGNTSAPYMEDFTPPTGPNR
jgi:hypothetical protein